MAQNIGAYAGFGKETTFGTAVAPTVYVPMMKPAKPKLKVPMISVPNTLNYGPLSTVPAIRNTELSAELAGSPEGIAVALSMLMGSPTTSGTNPNYTHTYTPAAATAIPSFTLETKDGIGVYRYSGQKLSDLALSHTPDGFLTATLTGMGKDRATQTATSPTITSEFFQQSGLVITANAVDISQYVEDVKVTIKFGKELFKGFGTSSILGVGIDGTAESKIALIMRTDGTDRTADYIAATARVLTLVWTLNANRSLSLTFSNVILDDDPQDLNNDTLGEARSSLTYTALSAGGALFTAVVKAGIAGTVL
jgi:hypothetical protein